MMDRLRPLLFPALALALAFAAWRSYGWQGLILAALMIVFWVLLHLTKLMRLLQAAAERPMGRVRDARALHNRLKRGKPLAAVLRLTLSLGLRRSEPEQDPEVLEWRDELGHKVVCTFRKGRLQAFEFQPAGQADADAPAEAAQTEPPRT